MTYPSIMHPAPTESGLTRRSAALLVAFTLAVAAILLMASERATRPSPPPATPTRQAAGALPAKPLALNQSAPAASSLPAMESSSAPVRPAARSDQLDEDAAASGMTSSTVGRAKGVSP